MKRLIIAIVVVAAVVTGLILATPYFIKTAILKYAQSEVSEKMNADLNVSNFELNIFDLSNSDIKLENVTITYRDSLEKVPLLDIPLLEASMDIKLFLLEEKIGMKNIFFSGAKFNHYSTTEGDINCVVSLNGSVDNSILKVTNSDILINDLKLDLQGEISETDRGFNVDLSLNAPNTEFESLLALIPKEHKGNFNDVKTKGVFSLKATAKGEYYHNNLPSFNISLKVDDASIQYPELAESINEINADIVVNNGGGATDSTNIYINKIGFIISENPFTITGKVLNIKNPMFDCNVDGIINFEKLSKVIPLEDITLKGIVETNVKFNGKYSDMQRGEYDKIMAKGTIKLNNLYFKDSNLIEGILLKSGIATITQSHLTLNNVVAKYMSSDLSLTGNIFNYMPFLFGETLADNKSPKVDFDIKLSNMDIKEIYKSSKTIRETMPFMKNCNGKISSRFKFKSLLNSDMNLITSTIEGGGYFETKGITIENSPFTKEISTIIKSNDVNKIGKLKADFSINNNIIKVIPFTTTLAGNKSRIFGTQSISGALDYTISMNILRCNLSGNVTNVLNKIPGVEAIKDVDIDIKIGGTIENPTYKPDLSKAINKVTKEFMKDPKKGLLEGLSNFFGR